MVTINDIDAYEVLDSRGNPTVCVRTVLSDGSVGSSIVPSGASTGKKEALEMRDKDSRYFGRGVRSACNNVRNSIAAELVGMCPFDQTGLDGLLKQLDDTEGYSSLGANAVLGVSISVARASSRSLNIPLYRYIGGINARFLPTPMLNIINGGAHANNRVDFQEYMVMPVGFSSFADAMRASAEIYHCLKEILSDAGLNTGVGDEGGFSPDLKNNEEPIEYILRAVERSGYKGGDDVFIAIDVASSELFENGLYNLRGEGRQLDSAGMIDYYQGLVAKYPILSIEDGLSEDDWEGWKSLTRSLGSRIQLVGDDLFVTNENILRRGIDDGVGNAILIKPNQIGTLTETMNAVQLAHLNGYSTIVSHRSGDSEDSFIADLAIALSSFQIKTGAPARGERNAKYNRLLEIEHFDSGVSYSAKSEFNKLTR